MEYYDSEILLSARREWVESTIFLGLMLPDRTEVKAA